MALVLSSGPETVFDGGHDRFDMRSVGKADPRPVELLVWQDVAARPSPELGNPRPDLPLWQREPPSHGHWLERHFGLVPGGEIRVTVSLPRRDDRT